MKTFTRTKTYVYKNVCYFREDVFLLTTYYNITLGRAKRMLKRRGYRYRITGMNITYLRHGMRVVYSRRTRKLTLQQFVKTNYREKTYVETN